VGASKKQPSRLDNLTGVQPESSERPVGLVDRLTYHNAKNEF
jgi:hypothetical protein